MAQLASAAMAILLIASSLFVILPADNCKRSENLTLIGYSFLSITPLVGEKLLQRNMASSWVDADTTTAQLHKWVSGYLAEGKCALPKYTLFGRTSGLPSSQSDDWLKKNDPELYKMIRGPANDSAANRAPQPAQTAKPAAAGTESQVSPAASSANPSVAQQRDQN